MRDLKQYWEAIRALEASLPEFVWVISEGCLSEVSAHIAAKLLHAKSHRVATEEEVRARKASDEAAQTEKYHAERARRGVAVVALNGNKMRSVSPIRLSEPSAAQSGDRARARGSAPHTENDESE